MKTKDEILECKEKIQKQLDVLPDESVFGEDNSEEKEEMQSIIDQLESAADGRIVRDQFIRDWIDGKPSYIDDFFPDEKSK